MKLGSILTHNMPSESRSADRFQEVEDMCGGSVEV